MPSRSTLRECGPLLLLMIGVQLPPFALIHLLRWLEHRNQPHTEAVKQPAANTLLIRYDADGGWTTDHDGKGNW